MNIAMMSNWGMRCGVSEYAYQLVQALKKVGMDITIFGSYAYQEPVREDEQKVFRCFGTGFQMGLMDKNLIINEILERGISILHIQYQSYLYPDKENFYSLLRELKGKIKLVVTFHDSCIDPYLPINLFDKIIEHGPEFERGGDKTYHMPIGMVEFPYIVPPDKNIISSFGLGRNDNELVQRVCNSLGWTFKFHDSQSNWASMEELMKFLQDSDIITLIYPPTDAHVSSSAVKIALAAKRPVIVSDSRWFSDVHNYVLKTSLEDINIERTLKLARTDVIKNIAIEKAEEALEKWAWGKLAKVYKEEIYESDEV